jgi:phage shock protein A
MQAETELAIKFRDEGDKKQALRHMRAKKTLEAEVEKMEAAIMNLETQVIQIESTNSNIQTFNTVSKATELMKDMTGHVDADRVDAMQDEIKENQAL